jgi:ABC-2 type transport system ATP-binding protein
MEDGAAGAGINLAGLTKTFRSPEGPVHAVRGIDVEIPRGQAVALLGPNGAGKSTTIDMLLGLTPPDAGTVSVFGREPRAAIQYLSVRELLTMVAGMFPSPAGVGEVMAQTGLERIAGRRTQKLSGGETQRVRFAIALISNPDLLVLDEPTVAMDVESRREFWDAMRAFAARGKTVLFATHYLEEADQNADRVILMARGEVVADGPPTEIKGRVGVRTLRATLPGVEAGELAQLPGANSAERRGDAVVVVCADSDQTIRALLDRFPAASDIEITGGALEDAFLALTADEPSVA